MPEFLPDRLEAGTHNIPGIAGLYEGLRYVVAKGENAILSHERELLAKAARELSKIPGITVYVSDHPELQAGVLSFVVQGKDCEEIGEQLGKRDIAVRAGLHCAPYAHETVGTEGTGTVRISFSAFNTAAEIKAFSGTVEQIVKQKK